VANVELAILAVAVIAALIAIIARLNPGAPRRRSRALVGLIPGTLGAFLVLTLNVDLVPDELESRALPLVVLVISGAIAVITLRRFVSH
jgi:hypothetical protein